MLTLRKPGTLFFLSAVLLISVFSGCSKQEEITFQKNKADPEVKLFHIFDETPAIKSLFDDIDLAHFNERANMLINSNPELMVDLLQRLSLTFYGHDASFPLTVRDVSESFSSFYRVNSQDPVSLDAAIDMGDRVLSLDRETMIEGVDSIEDLLTYLRDETPVFREGQEFGDIGMDGINELIDTFGFVRKLYENASDLSSPAELAANFLSTIVDDNVDVEKRVDEIIDYLKKDPDDPESVASIEKGVADCHSKDRFIDETLDCLTCHANADHDYMAQHMELYGTNCVACHDGVDRMRDFDHSDYYALEGQHAEAECLSCHQDLVYAGTSQDCASCHQDPKYEGMFGKDCARCHTITAWLPALLTQHTFMLTHGWLPVDGCKSCHTAEFTTSDCVSCHDHTAEMMQEFHLNCGLEDYVSKSCVDCHPTGEKSDTAEQACTSDVSAVP